jgi:hypothetical protein
MKKILKIIGIVLLIIIVVPLIIALFVKKEYGVEKVVTINKPKSFVYDYVKFLKNQDNYSVWFKLDPNAKKEYSGTDGTVGFVSAWSSTDKDLGKGEQEIKSIKDGERIDYELRFKEPMQSTEKAYMLFESVDSTHVNVKWGFNGKMKYPMNLMMLCMDFEGMIGKDLQSGLEGLKTIMEKQNAVP